MKTHIEDAATQSNGVYESRPIKRARRTKAQMEAIREAIYKWLSTCNPATVRQTFYAMTVRGIVPKEEKECKTVGRLLVAMRRAGRVPYSWIGDNTRMMRKPRSFSSMEEALARTAQTYRRALWDTQAVYVEIWCEKDALAGVIYEVTNRWDVPLMPSRGFSSETFLYSAAETIKAQRKPAYIYYVGDHDPSGVHIDRVIERRLRAMAPKAEIHFQRLAVLPHQIQEMNLPTRPTKKKDKRSKNFKGESVELDAIPPARLRQIIEAAIEQHVDRHALEVLREAERSEREIFSSLQSWLANQSGSKRPPEQPSCELQEEEDSLFADLREEALQMLKDWPDIGFSWQEAAECLAASRLEESAPDLFAKVEKHKFTISYAWTLYRQRCHGQQQEG